MQAGFFCIGAAFWFDSMMGGRSFTPQLWGTLAYAIPAKALAAWTLASASITLVGLIKPIKRMHVVIGSIMHMMQFTLLAYSASVSGGEFVVTLYACFIFIPMHGWLLLEAILRG